MSRCVPACTGVFRCMQSCSGITGVSKHVHACIHMCGFKYVQMCLEMSRYVLACVGMCHVCWGGHAELSRPTLPSLPGVKSLLHCQSGIWVATGSSPEHHHRPGLLFLALNLEATTFMLRDSLWNQTSSAPSKATRAESGHHLGPPEF